MSRGVSKGRAFWTGHVADWKRSGNDRATYCDAHGLKRKTLSWWIWRLTHEARSAQPVPPVAFVPVSVSPEPSSPKPSAPIDAAPAAVSVEIRTSGRTRILLDGTDASTIAAIVAALERR